MEIRKNNICENRTYKYLYPTLVEYGEDLMKHLRTYFKLGVGISDKFDVEDSVGNIFILFDTEPPTGSLINPKYYKEGFNNFLNWVRYKDYYVKDYIYKDVKYGNEHMLVLKLPLTLYQYFSFIFGKYSYMFSYEQIQKYFKFVTLENKNLEQIVNNKFKNTVGILTKDRDYIETFVNIVNNDFGTDVKYEDYIDKELDYPVNMCEEVFNY